MTYQEAMGATSRQLDIRGVVTLADTTTINLTNQHIITYSIDEGSNEIPLGSAGAAEFILEVANTNGEWLEGGSIIGYRQLMGAKVSIEIGVYHDGAWEFKPAGVWYANTFVGKEGDPRFLMRGGDALLTSYDDLLDDSGLTYTGSTTLNAVLNHIKSKHGVSITGSLACNGGAIIAQRPDWGEGCTVRNALSLIAGAGGCFVRVNRAGGLELVPVKGTATAKAISTTKYMELESGQGAFSFNRIKVKPRGAEADAPYIEGVVNGNLPEAGNNTLVMEDNPIFAAEASNLQSMANALASALSGYEVPLLTFKHRGDPTMMPGDRAQVTDRRGKATTIPVLFQRLLYANGMHQVSSSMISLEMMQPSMISRNGTISPIAFGKGSLDPSVLIARSITADQIAVGAITAESAVIAEGAIGSVEIDELSANKITSGTLNAGNVSLINVDAGSITVGKINGVQIANGAVDMQHLSETGVVQVIQNAQNTADGKNKVFYRTAANKPTAADGLKVDDLLFITDMGYQPNRWDGTAWVPVPFSTDALAANAITTAKLATGAVNADKIAANAVTAAAIQAGVIEGTHIAGNTISGNKLVVGTVESTYIADGAIITDKLGASAVTAGKLAANAVTANKILAGAVTAGKIGAGAVTATNIDSEAIQTGHLSDGARQQLLIDAQERIELAVSNADNYNNLLLNSAFRSGQNEWITSQTTGLAYVSTPAVDSPVYTSFFGDTAYRVGIVAGNTDYVRCYQSVPVVAGRTYTFSAYYYVTSSSKTNLSGGASPLVVFFYDSVGNQLSFSSAITIDDLETDKIARANLTVTAPSGAATARVYIRVQQINTSGTRTVIHFSRLMLSEGSALMPWSPSPSDPASGVKTSHITIETDTIDIQAGGKLTMGAGTTAMSLDNTGLKVGAVNTYFNKPAFYVEPTGSNIYAIKGNLGVVTFDNAALGIVNKKSTDTGHPDGWERVIWLYNSGIIQAKTKVISPIFSDNTPGYDGSALDELRWVQTDGAGGIDHSTLPPFAQDEIITQETLEDSTEVEVVTPGRNLGALMSIVVRGIQELTDRLETVEERTAE